MFPSLPQTGAALVPGAHSMASHVHSGPEKSPSLSTQTAPKEQKKEPQRASDREPEGKYTREDIKDTVLLVTVPN